MFYIPFVSENTVLLYTKQQHVKIQQHKTTTCQNTAKQSNSIVEPVLYSYFHILLDPETIRLNAYSRMPSWYVQEQLYLLASINLHKKATTCQTY
jgi:hypothetical protein